MAISLNIRGGFAHLWRQYDKLMAFLALALLLASLVYLAVRVGLIQSMKRDFDMEMKSLRAMHEKAATVAADVFDAAVAGLDKPVSLGHQAWTNVAFSVPEVRVTCTDQRCQRPVPYAAATCPLCLSPQREDKTEVEPPKDSDGDGMLDDWELQYGLDRYDAGDAANDTDGDGHKNLGEFLAKTDPTDPASRPPVIDQLRVEKVSSVSFGILFKSRVTTGKGERFGLNYRQAGQIKTDFVGVGDTVAGFLVSKFDHKTRDVDQPYKHKQDVSELTLVRGDHTIVLVRGQDYNETEQTAHFVSLFDDAKYLAKQGEFLTVDGSRYEVIEIDTRGERVVLRPENDSGQTVVVRRLTVPR